jgi:hypothetical protein
LQKIVGEDAAKRYASRFGPLESSQSGGEILNYEALSIYAYSTELTWHQRINTELWSGTPSEEVLLFTSVLNQTLAKLPPYLLNNRIVYRGYHCDDIAALASSYQNAGTVRFLGFTSATFDPKLAFGGNVFFTIRTLTGKAIWYLAASYAEFEVLIPSGRSFSVSKIDSRERRPAIDLEELP